MPWWQWVVLGAVLLGSELFVVDAGFYLAILGLAALLVGFGAGVGLAGPLWLQWAIFGALALALLAGVRRQFYRRLRGAPAAGFEPLIGETATVTDAIAPGGIGRAQLRGSDWTARNIGESPLDPGRRARVESVRDLVIELRAEEKAT